MAAAAKPPLSQIFEAEFALRPSLFRRAGMLEQRVPTACLVRQILIEGPRDLRVDLIVNGQPVFLDLRLGLYAPPLVGFTIPEGALLGVAFGFRRWRPWQRGWVTLWGRQL